MRADLVSALHAISTGGPTISDPQRTTTVWVLHAETVEQLELLAPPT